jgi:hypothetical protein
MREPYAQREPYQRYVGHGPGDRGEHALGPIRTPTALCACLQPYPGRLRSIVCECPHLPDEALTAAHGTTVTLPKPMTSGAKVDGRFDKQDFGYLPRKRGRLAGLASAEGQTTGVLLDAFLLFYT